MRIDFSGVKDMNYLTEGKHLVKITKVEDDIDWVDVYFIDRDGAQHKERYFLKDSVLWRLYQLAKACGAVNENKKEIDTQELLGCYVNITLAQNTFTDKFGREKTYLQVAKVEPTNIPRDTKTVMQQQHQTQQMQQQQYQEPKIPEIDINDEEIPF